MGGDAPVGASLLSLRLGLAWGVPLGTPCGASPAPHGAGLALVDYVGNYYTHQHLIV